jgi:hypothetical protein
MNEANDVWYVRLPDGRVLRAASTLVLRQHLGTGRIPSDSRVRRSFDDEWIGLDWTEEFADLVQRKNGNAGAPAAGAVAAAPDSGIVPGPAGVARRFESGYLHTVGLQGMAEELVAALDNTLARPKLLVACAGGVLGGAIVATTGAFSGLLGSMWPWLPHCVAAAGLLLVGVACTVLLTQMTYTELSRLRPAYWAEARAGLLKFSIRLLLAFLIAGGGAVLAIVLLRRMPQLIFSADKPDAGSYRPLAIDVLKVLALLIEVVLWPVVGFTLLLGPVIVVEESSALTALGQWWWLVRRHLGRLFLYQSAAALGGIAMLAFAYPLVLAGIGRLGDWSGFDTATGFALCMLTGLATAPLLAYIAVAHVFIYLNLRYEYDHARRA